MKLVPTAVAAAYTVFPLCVTSIEQVPVAMNEAVLPDTVHTAAVVDLKLTANPELAEATRLSVVPSVWLAIFPKVIVWLSFVTVKLCDALAAA